MVYQIFRHKSFKASKLMLTCNFLKRNYTNSYIILRIIVSGYILRMIDDILFLIE